MMMSSRPFLFFAFHDPEGIQTENLRKMLPILRENFQGAFVSVTPETAKRNPAVMTFFQESGFFTVNINEDKSTVGDHLLSGFKNVIAHANPDQLIHLCASDRLSFALLGTYKDRFLADVHKVTIKDVPFLFMRSKKAWETHPKNYYAAEIINTVAGKLLFGQTLDFTWCHLVITAQQLAALLGKIKTRDFVILAEMVYLLKDKIKTKEVDWLAWEDPFVFGKDPQELKEAREKDPAEVEKRLGYVLPVVDYLLKTYTEKSENNPGKHPGLT